MPVLQSSRVLATCDECRTRFDPVNGGVCDSCRRLLCGKHYYGSVLRRIQGMLGMAPRCVACRAGRTPATADRRPAGGDTAGPSSHSR